MVVIAVLFAIAVLGHVEAATLSPRIVRTKQGSVKGVLVIPSNRDLQPVEAFLGLPFAAPPVGALRFMPPVSPLPWHGVRLMDKYAPACPQTLPDVSNEREALRHVTRGRLQYLRRLLPYLRNQSEDCLYLNIYAPVTGTLFAVRLVARRPQRLTSLFLYLPLFSSVSLLSSSLLLGSSSVFPKVAYRKRHAGGRETSL